jgi:hypothetical protein
MLAALLLAAEAAEKSKTPFYILATLLILFGFGLGIGGSTRAQTFPGSDGAARAIMGVAVLLVAGTMVTAVLTA